MTFLKNFIWMYLTIPLLLAVSISFSFRFGFPQFKIGKMVASLMSRRDKPGEISPVASLAVALSSRIGVGTLAGVGLALSLGGPGSIFWMWIAAVISSAATYGENTLAQKFKKREGEAFFGGPAFYIEKRNRSFGFLYAILLIVTYTLGFSAVQMNTISLTLDFPPIGLAVLLTLLTAIIIFSGILRVAKLVAKIVPIIAIFFFAMSMIAIIINIAYIPAFFIEIITDALNFGSFTTGAGLSAIVIGVKRGVFSNEAGLGTGAHAAAITHHDDPREQGYIGVLGIYLTTLVCVTLVAFLIMSTGAHRAGVHAGNGIEYLNFALMNLFGPIGSILLTISIFAFGFSTVITAYLYGEINAKYLSSSPFIIWGLRLLVLIVVFISTILDGSTIWSLVDIGVGITALINLIALFMLERKIK